MADFIYTCSTVGIDKLLFVRHANAEPLKEGSPIRKDIPHDWRRNDQMRPLSKKGKAQCAEKSALLKDLEIRINLSSPARRATETAMLLTLDAAGGGDIALRMIESLHPSHNKCEDLFDELGYGPLRKFFDVEGGKESFQEYGNKVCKEMNAKIGGPAVGGMHGDTIAVFGHAVFLNAVAYVAASEWKIQNAEDLIEYDLNEADAILVDKRSNTVSYLKA